MSKKPATTGKARTKTKFSIRKLRASQIVCVVLEELSREYADVCNFAEAVSLARSGDLYLALLSVKESERKNGLLRLGSAETSARAVWVYSQATSVLKKCVDRSYDSWPETRDLWFATERRCERLNKKFDAITARRASGTRDVPFAKELYRFYEGLHHVLGDTPPTEEILMASHYGPGSSVGVRGQDVNFVRKVESNECVSMCVDLAARALVFDKATWVHLGLDPTYSHVESAQQGFIRVARERLSANIVSHDRLMFIFKNMTSRRSIGAQPTCSGMVQLGIHTIGAQLLRDRANIDLADQGWNRQLAHEGSRDWDKPNPWCTLDKSNASNLIANGLVKNLFPPLWAKLLQRTRTPGYEAPPELGGDQHMYHMYAGMGNGTTFFVETLVFWAATYATQDLPVEEYVKRKPYAVYGDDVILRKDHALRYMRFAKFLGFQFNPNKTFLEGPFRESCGADYFAGIPVGAATLTSEDGFIDLPTLVSFHNNLADNQVFALKGACEKLRSFSQQYLYPIIPTDPAGDLGFRPVDCSYYDIVKDASGKAVLSPAWQRPRTFMLEVRPKWGDLGELDSWTQIAVALLRARQEGPKDNWSLPIRDLVNYKVISEKDLNRGDLKRMLLNQLTRLSVWKSQPWWQEARGL